MKNKKKFLVIGNPIKHSLSPQLHKYWFGKNKINAEYKKLKIDQKQIKKILDKIRKKDFFEYFPEHENMREFML